MKRWFQLLLSHQLEGRKYRAALGDETERYLASCRTASFKHTMLVQSAKPIQWFHGRKTYKGLWTVVSN